MDVSHIFAQPQAAHVEEAQSRPDLQRLRFRKITAAEMFAQLGYEDELEMLPRDEWERMIEMSQR